MSTVAEPVGKNAPQDPCGQGPTDSIMGPLTALGQAYESPPSALGQAYETPGSCSARGWMYNAVENLVLGRQ